ncbi:MAG TPA: ABC transporter permease [Clostridia bacterium]|nr:ABC transporter permease [Clostridia bacterium]
MIVYIIKRIFLMIPIILALTFVVFSIVSLTPSDAAYAILGSEYTEENGAQLRAELGLDKPFFVRYFKYIVGLAQGDMGISYINKAPVIDQLKARFPNTFKITIMSMTFSVLIGLPIGVVTATKPNSFLSRLSLVIGMMGISIPGFWLGMLMILFFAVKLGWLPSSGVDEGFRSLILPSLTLGINFLASVMRTTRSSMMETVRTDYVRTARSKGLSERKVIFDHALGNALMPTITVVGVQVGTLLGSMVLTETVFAIPGTGRLLVEAINKRDMPTVLGALVLLGVCVAVCNLVVDIIYAYIDPRIKAQYTGRT